MIQSQSDKWNHLVGKRFGRLTVLEIVKEEGSVEWFGCLVKCICICGNEKVIGRRYLTRGQCKSCGCLNTASREFYRRKS